MHRAPCRHSRFAYWCAASYWCAGLQAGTAFPLWYIANTVPFRDIVGHRGVTTRIARAIARDTFPPSVILTGPEGVGKRLAAMATAEATNCAEPRTDDAGFAIDACGACSVCRRIGRAVFPDVVVVEPPDSASGAITIDQVRDVVEQVAYRPFEGRRRVVVIDEADLMAAQAQNALLKTLEEPPSASQFILVTARPDVLLDTVRSRCPRLRFGLLADDEIASVLIDRHNIEPRLARASAASSGGSLGRALRSAAGELAVSRDAAVGRSARIGRRGARHPREAGGSQSVQRRVGSKARAGSRPGRGASPSSRARDAAARHRGGGGRGRCAARQHRSAAAAPRPDDGVRRQTGPPVVPRRRRRHRRAGPERQPEDSRRLGGVPPVTH